MTANSDGTYTLAVYIPEKVDFLYQYLMVIGSEAGPGTVVWEVSTLIQLLQRRRSLIPLDREPSNESAGWKKPVRLQGGDCFSKMTFAARVLA